MLHMQTHNQAHIQTLHSIHKGWLIARMFEISVSVCIITLWPRENCGGLRGAVEKDVRMRAMGKDE